MGWHATIPDGVRWMEKRRLRYHWIYATTAALILIFILGGVMSLLLVEDESFDESPMFFLYPPSPATCVGMTRRVHTEESPTPTKGLGREDQWGNSFGAPLFGTPIATPVPFPEAPKPRLPAVPIEAVRPLEEWGDDSPLEEPSYRMGPSPVPYAFRKRFTPEDRIERLRSVGLKPALDDRVTRALRFLRSNQQPDGSWPGPATNTALVLLAHHGQGHSLLSEESGESLLKATLWLTKIDGDAPESADAEAVIVWSLAEAEMLRTALDIEVPGLRERLVGRAQRLISRTLDEASPPPAPTSVWRLIALKAIMFSGIDAADLKRAVRIEIAHLASSDEEIATYVGGRLFAIQPQPPGDLRSAPLPDVGPESFVRAFGTFMAGDEVARPVVGPWFERLVGQIDENGGWAGDAPVATTAWAVLTLESPYRHVYPGQ